MTSEVLLAASWDPRFNVLPFINALAFIAASRTSNVNVFSRSHVRLHKFSQRPLSQLSIIVRTGLYPQSRGYLYPRRDSRTVGAKLEQSTPSARLDSRAAETDHVCFQSHALSSTPLLSYQHPHEALACQYCLWSSDTTYGVIEVLDQARHTPTIGITVDGASTSMQA